MELITAIVFTVGINICYALYLFYFEGVNLWDALKQSLYGTLSLIVLALIALPLIIIFLAVGRSIKRARNKNS
jgi:uncharacterized membrane protein YagU involved in acid resistance